MKISALSRLAAVAAVLMLCAMGALVFRALHIQDGIIRGADQRVRLLRLADELFQSSEDLSRMARAYVATADPVHEERYFAILDMRDGKRPRPRTYAPTHWHLAGVGKGPAVEQAPAVSLPELMRREDFSAGELALLRLSQSNSERLAGLEKQAFASMKRGDRGAAVGLLYGARYGDEKAAVMAPIQRLADAVDARTAARLDTLRAGLQRQITLLVALVGLALLGVALLIVYTRRAVLAPLALLGRDARAIAGGDYAVRCAIRSGNELAGLGALFNQMLESVERDIGRRGDAERALARANAELAGREILLTQILDTSSVAIFLVDMRGRLMHANERMAEMFGWPAAAALVGKEYVELVNPSEREAGRGSLFKLLASETGSIDLERHYLRADGSEFFGHLTGKRLCDADGVQRGMVGVIADISARKLAELRERHHNRVLEMLAAKAPLADLLDAIARDVEAIHPGMACSIMLLDAAGQCLRRGAAAGLPVAYLDAIDGLPVGPGACACGAAAFSGLPVIAADLAGDPDWTPLLAPARAAGLKACWSQPVLSSQGRVLGCFAVYHREPCRPAPADLRFIQAEARLAAVVIENTRAEALLQLAASVFTHAREGIMITDAAGTIVEVNATFTGITGYSRDEVVGGNPRLLKSDRQSPQYYAALWRALTETGSWDGEIWNRRKDGGLYAEMITISAVRDAAGQTRNYVALFTDITPIKEHQQQLERIAHHDVLTGLPNRVLLADRLEQAIAHSQRQRQSLAVVYLDLDGFKAVNDQHGHDVGDELLIAIAQRMRRALRDGDTLARIGGDEFVAVLAGLDQAADCEPVLARLLQAAAEPVQAGGARLRVSASIGVTLYPQDGSGADLLLRHADQAMYLAKQAGGRRYHLFDVDQDTAVKTRHASLERIRVALERREFVLYYQPQVDMKSGRVVGAEALIRWQHPEDGLLAPAVFLPIIAEHPFSVELGEWVIDTALAQMAAWQGAGLTLPVSVNVGARQLQQGGFAARLAALLAAHADVPPARLELEILETSALEDVAQVSDVMHACRALGVRFALDDFGTGYSSLTHLRRLPAELLKIDQSFVRDMLDDPEDLAIVDGVVGLAAAFRRGVIAEGVETVAHGELLLALGCELAQGYGIARPMPARDLPGWVAGWCPPPAWTAWRGRALARDDLALLFAEVEHRHWLRAVEATLAGERPGPPPLDAHQCAFGHWLETAGRARYGELAQFARLGAAHERVHALGRELVAAAAGPGPARLQPLRALHDELVGQLRALAGGAAPPDISTSGECEIVEP